MTDVGKRRAYESPGDLARPVPRDPAMRRPTTTVVGAVLVLLRVLAGVAWLVALAIQWRSVIAGELEGFDVDLDAEDVGSASDLALAIVLIGGGMVLVFELALAVLIYLGSNWPRILVMVFATISISATFIAWWVGEQTITLDETLVTLALDILVMLALSSRSARSYARRNRRLDKPGARPLRAGTDARRGARA
ncbi:hypothetical protein ACGGZK_02760 [Agromyces sp. MMS24-K17]|uniref:hypothetical protein n=1 Tax=Agromyces sp. MMS24-K17 TaxID=3372850 RepID=UPI0037553B3E